MKTLIIGKNGNLGSEIVRAYEGEDIVALGHTELDVIDQQAVFDTIKQLQPNVVYNCVAYNAVDIAESDYENAVLLNATTVGYIAQACRAVDATFVHFSTGMVFLGNREAGYNEQDKPEPVNAYGRSKLLGETAAAQVPKHYIIRTEWLYAALRPGIAKKSFNEIMIDLAAKNGSVTAVNDEFGKPTWTKDLAHAAKELVTANVPYGIYHLANEGVASRYDWALEIFKILGQNTPVAGSPGSTFPRPAARPRYEVLNNTKRPLLRSWQNALKDYLTSN